MQQSPFTESELAGIKGFDDMLGNIQSLAITLDTANTSSLPGQRAEASADVSCFLNSSFADEIERGEFQKVSGFLRRLRKKMVMHQKVSSRSKRIFKPATRQQRIWMANHLGAFRRLEGSHAHHDGHESKLPPSRPFSMIDMRKYQKRTSIIMAMALKRKPARPMICHLEDVDFFHWNQTRNKRQQLKQQWLLDLDEMEAEPIQHQQPSMKLDYSPKCHCVTFDPWCRMFGNSESWLLDNFGCGYAKHCFEYFQQQTVDPQPFFRMLIQYPMQLVPLKLKDGMMNARI